MAVRVEIDRAGVEAVSQHIDGKAARAAGEILKEARANAPVRTGALKASGHLDKIKRGKYRVTFDPRGKRGQAYAVFVEKGTRHMSAQPYLRPAAFKPRAFS